MPQQYWQTPYNNWNQPQMPSWMTYQSALPAQGMIQQRPSGQMQQEAHMVNNNFQPTRDFAEAFNIMTLAEPSQHWYMDSGASSHVSSEPGNLQSVVNLRTGNSIIMGNGSKIPILFTGNSSFPSNSKPLHLKNVLVAPNIVKNLISVRKFSRDNWCSIEFDPFGFSVKDLQTKKLLLRSDSSGDLYSRMCLYIKLINTLPWFQKLLFYGINALLTQIMRLCDLSSLLSLFLVIRTTYNSVMLVSWVNTQKFSFLNLLLKILNLLN